MSIHKASAEKTIGFLKKNFNIDREKSRLADIVDSFFWESLEICAPHTLLSSEKLLNLYEATVYLAKNEILGDFVECGVFLGGAVMMVARTLSKLGVRDRKIYLYDTFSGFATPARDEDVNIKGEKIGHQVFQNFRKLTEKNLQEIDYPPENYIFVEGDVQQTVQNHDRNKIALLRLDTDTYSTTMSELTYLYPKLVRGGILILDDYGYSKGVRKAVDEYFSTPEKTIFFQRPNYSSRTAVKC